MTVASAWETGRSFANTLDAQDPLARFRNEFHFPLHTDGEPALYLCGNSLGLQPKRTRERVLEELDDWAKYGVEGHFHPDKESPWFSYHEQFRAGFAHLVGAEPTEVVAMNSLTTNLHLMMVSFYRPTSKRYKILIEGGAFPSDRYAMASQARFHGFDPAEAVLEFPRREGEVLTRMEDLEALLAEHGHEIALVIPAGVNYYTGQVFDMERITKLAHDAGCLVGFDLAHAVGNVPLQLHDWGVDFAVWCTYKYLNSGPGGVGGCFVHQRHEKNPELPRFAGWWGHDASTRFEMGPHFDPNVGADGWQLSNAPVLSMTALKASLELFLEAGFPNLRAKSIRLTQYLDFLLSQWSSDKIEILTPTAEAERGCQFSIRVKTKVSTLFETLQNNGVIGDVRDDVIRIAPTPLYNSFVDVWRFSEILRSCVAGDD
jgi:kynureninase